MLWVPPGWLHPRASPHRHQVCRQGLLLEAPEPGLREGGWQKITDLIRVLSAAAVRHNKIYQCAEKPIESFHS